jgi:hypothetical protein
MEPTYAYNMMMMILHYLARGNMADWAFKIFQKNLIEITTGGVLAAKNLTWMSRLRAR